MSATLAEASRLLGLLALLSSFAILVTRQAQPVAYAAQLGLVGGVALCQSVLQGDWGLAVSALVLAAQGVLLWSHRTQLTGLSTFPAATVCGGLLLVVLATASAPVEGLAVPLAIVLLGLLGAATNPGPYGVCSLLNGAVLGMAVLPGLPLRPLGVLVLAALAFGVMTEGRPVWVRR